MVRIGVLTSSRADFGVYMPLLKAFRHEEGISFEIIAFGTHLSKYHGFTVDEIIQNNFKVKYRISTLLADDSENAIATSAALTSLKFADFWADHKNEFDVVLCLGDRYEMFSAVISGVPFGINFAHLYGGDFSKGAIDNVYRDAMTHASKIHFTSTQKCADRVAKMKVDKEQIDVIGILSLDELEEINLLSVENFKAKWNIDLTKPTILITFHPETIAPENNSNYAIVVKNVLSYFSKKLQLVITLPNADANGSFFRRGFDQLKNENPTNIFLIQNFGVESYFTCMKHSLLLVGNTSSGISEAASFRKYFVNVGNRQIGRTFGENVINVGFEETAIINAVELVKTIGDFRGENIYHKPGAIKLILKRIKSFKV